MRTETTILTSQRVAAALRAAGYTAAKGSSMRTMRPGFHVTQERRHRETSVRGDFVREPYGPVIVHHFGGWKGCPADEHNKLMDGYAEALKAKGWSTMRKGHHGNYHLEARHG